jgi:hypothetical protein
MMPAMARVDRSMRFAGVALVLVVIAACKSTTPTQPSGQSPPAPSAAAAFGLFCAGNSWRFAIKSESSIWDDADPAADAQGNVTTVSTSETTCKVTATSRSRAVAPARSSATRAPTGAWPSASTASTSSRIEGP